MYDHTVQCVVMSFENQICFFPLSLAPRERQMHAMLVINHDLIVFDFIIFIIGFRHLNILAKQNIVCKILYCFSSHLCILGEPDNVCSSNILN